MATAVRANPGRPSVDGRLDDAAWENAPAHSGFYQRDPAEGEPATERTVFRICYDDEALYVGIRCYDSEPEGIVARLTRRDDDIEADWVRVSLDPRLDRQTGFWFSAYASGAVVDGVYSGDRSMDSAWNGVWEVETRVDGKGWTAEYRIPYHALRFSPDEDYVWGLNVERDICRKQERVHWSLTPRSSTGLVSRFGRLEGLRDVEPPLHLELVPYAMGRTIVDGGEDWFGNIGTDLRYGITSGTSLNLTINPDFGQVEADPATLNLTAFEEFYEEKRPFFIEGSSIFSNADYDVFHSRRIGRRPGYLSLPDDVREVDRPEATTIGGAVKLTGKTRNQTTFGVLNAVTAREYAEVERQHDGQVHKEKILVEPLANYLVGRVKRDVLDGTSMIGAMVTSVHREDAASAYTGVADWDLRYDQGRYQITGTLAGTRTGRSGERKNGYIGHLEFDKRGGWLEAETGVAAISPDADLNDVGYLRRGDQISNWYSATVYRHTRWRALQRFDVSTEWELEWNYDGLLLDNAMDVSLWADTRSNWDLHFHVGREFRSMDDDDVRRGGPVIHRPAENWVHCQVETDDRRALTFSVRPAYRRHDGGAAYERSLQLSAGWRPASGVWLYVAPAYVHQVRDAQWVDAIADAAMPEGVHFVYGELDSKTLDLTTRARISFTPDVSLELYLQPFVAIGDYTSFKELVEQETYRFEPYQLEDNRDFHRRSLNSNLVLRWEFRPGSILYTVWSQSRDASLPEVTDEDLELRPLSRLGSAFTDEGRNVFLVKISYWYGL